MSNLSELLPTGGGQNVVGFVATGTLSSGQTVILKADGTVEAVAETNISESVAGNNTVTSYNIEQAKTVDVGNSLVLTIYTDFNNNSYLTGKVGFISGSTITYSTPQVIYSGGTESQYFGNPVYIEDGKAVVSYMGASSVYYGNVIHSITASGFSIGSQATIYGSAINHNNCVYDSTNQRLVFVFRRTSNQLGYYSTATISGSTLSVGSLGAFPSSSPAAINGSYNLAEGVVVFTFSNQVVAGDASTSTVSWGSFATFDGSSVGETSFPVYATEQQKTVIVYFTSNAQKSVVLSLSGTAITANTAVQIASASTSYASAVYVGSGQIAASFSHDSSAYNIKGYLGTISGTSTSWSGPLSLASQSNAREQFMSYSSGTNNVVVTFATGAAPAGTISRVWQTPYSVTNNTSFIGITAGAISNAATGTVNVYGGVNEAQTGLTVGQNYYVQSNGSLSTTVSDVLAGRAINATTINITDLNYD